MRGLLGNSDRAHQLTDVISPSRASDRASYRYDKAGNPIRRTEMGFGVTNSFNNLNQIVSGIWTGGAITVAGAVNYAAGTVTVAGVTGTIYPDRTFDAANVAVTAGTNVLTAVYHGPAFTNTQMVATDKVTVVVGNAAYTHDANGNLTGDQNFTYQYDLANRLTNVILKASNISVLAISYDGLGRRIQVVRNGTTVERYVYLPGSFLILAILDGSNAVKEIYTHGPDLSGTLGGAGGIGGILAVKYPQQTNLPTYFVHGDAMGHIILATDPQAKEIGHYRYSPFGRPLNQTGTFTPRFLYSSKEYDPESGLLNFGYRHLNPQLGRWMERDRIDETGGVNLYECVRNQPVRLFDALGLIYGIGNPVSGPTGPVAPSVPFVPNPLISTPVPLRGPGIYDQINPFGIRGRVGREDYTAWFNQRFPRSTSAAITLMRLRISEHIRIRYCFGKAESFDPQELGQNATVDISDPNMHRFGDRPQSFFERRIAIGAFQYKVRNISILWDHHTCTFQFTAIVYVSEITGATPPWEPGASWEDVLTWPTMMFVSRNVEMANWSISGDGICD